MTITKIESTQQSQETRYTDKVYVDATKTDGSTVQVLDVRQTRIVTKSQLEEERDNDQAEADKTQSKLDEITALEAE